MFGQHGDEEGALPPTNVLAPLILPVLERSNSGTGGQSRSKGDGLVNFVQFHQVGAARLSDLGAREDDDLFSALDQPFGF